MAHEGSNGNGGGNYATPPYISYKTFGTFLGDLKEHGMPPVVDRSVLSRFSGGVAGQILSALTSLGLIDEKKRPTPELDALVQSYGSSDHKVRVRELVERNYPYVLALDLETATPSMFADAFSKNLAAKDEVLRKCRTFFLHAAHDVGIPIGARIQKAKFPRTRTSRKKKAGGEGANTSVQQNRQNQPLDHTETSEGGVLGQLLNKFPDFDPEWPDEIKAKWFEGFDQFMKGAIPTKKATSE